MCGLSSMIVISANKRAWWCRCFPLEGAAETVPNDDSVLMTNRTAEVIPLAKAVAKLDDVPGTPSDPLGRIEGSALVSLILDGFPSYKFFWR